MVIAVIVVIEHRTEPIAITAITARCFACPKAIRMVIGTVIAIWMAITVRTAYQLVRAT